ncbi:MAG: hypothetical protein M1136_00875 [Chloroflexi bacterium]|nr:hypothetical protein [Chloroflexota bacterium]
MGSHVWAEQCPYCGFEDMIVSSYDSFYFEIACQICGYARWVEERVPDNHDVELAKRALSEMDAEEKQKAMQLYGEDNIPLIARLKGNS